MDTKGPEVRTTAIAGGEPIPYQIGDKVKIVGNPAQETTRECIAVSYPGFVHDLQVDGDILIDDGDLELRVIEKTDEYLLCEVQNEATLGNRKSVNVPGVRINLPSLTEKAENDIRIPLDENSNDVTAFLAKQAVKATSKLNIRAIITDSFSGRTARNIAAFRGKYPVLAICYKEKTMRHLALSYGVEAIYMPEKANGQAYYFAALRKLLDDGVLSESDMVAYLSSGKQGTQTSFLEINVVGDVLKYAMDYVLPNRNRYL